MPSGRGERAARQGRDSGNRSEDAWCVVPPVQIERVVT